MTPRISEQIVAKYGHVAAFKVDMHHLYIRARMDVSWTWLPLPYRVSDAYIDEEISGWKEQWRPIAVPLNVVYPKKKKMQNEVVATETVGNEDEVRQNEEGEASRKGKEPATEQEDEAPQTENLPRSSSDSEKDSKDENEEESSAANVLPDDAEIVGGENPGEDNPGEDPKEETVAASRKRTAEESSSQRAKRTKRKSTKPTLDQNLTDDEIDLIALKVGVATDDALTDFQKN